MTSKTLESEFLPIIFDNTVLTNFALTQSFEILRRLYEGRAFVCKAVLQEVQAGIESGRKYPQLRSRTRLQVVNKAMEGGWLQLPNNDADPSEPVLELRLALEYSQRFGQGEAEAMAIAQTRGWILATDDGKARKFSKEHGIHLTGSVGILIKAAQQEIMTLTETDALHARMIDEGYRSPLGYDRGISNYLNRR
ncbi:MAG: nuclease [Oscillatoria sp. SIO1A7]|nr:nuclease [Oscillatoria sp. SIO1A7]